MIDFDDVDDDKPSFANVRATRRASKGVTMSKPVKMAKPPKAAPLEFDDVEDDPSIPGWKRAAMTQPIHSDPNLQFDGYQMQPDGTNVPIGQGPIDTSGLDALEASGQITPQMAAESRRLIGSKPLAGPVAGRSAINAARKSAGIEAVPDRDSSFLGQMMEIGAKAGVRAPAIVADAMRLPANANEAVIRQFGGVPEDDSITGQMRRALRTGADAIDTQPLVDELGQLGYGTGTRDSKQLVEAFNPNANANRRAAAESVAAAMGATGPTEELTLGDRIETVLRFIPETLLGSAPDMAAMVNPLTAGTYIAGRTNEIAETRADNDGHRRDLTLADIGIGAGAATVEGLLERFTTMRLLPQGTTMATPGVMAAIGRVARELGLQSSLGGVEELTPYLAETVGTQKGYDEAKATEAALGGMVAEGGLGGTVQAGKEVAEGLRTKTALDGIDLPSVEEQVRQLMGGKGPAPFVEPDYTGMSSINQLTQLPTNENVAMAQAADPMGLARQMADAVKRAIDGGVPNGVQNPPQQSAAEGDSRGKGQENQEGSGQEGRQGPEGSAGDAREAQADEQGQVTEAAIDAMLDALAPRIPEAPVLPQDAARDELVQQYREANTDEARAAAAARVAAFDMQQSLPAAPGADAAQLPGGTGAGPDAVRPAVQEADADLGGSRQDGPVLRDGEGYAGNTQQQQPDPDAPYRRPDADADAVGVRADQGTDPVALRTEAVVPDAAAGAGRYQDTADPDVVRALGPAAAGVTTISVADMPAEDVARWGLDRDENSEVEGFYDPDSGRSFVLEDRLENAARLTGMTIPQRRTWVAAHERAGHAGLRGMAGDSATLGTILDRASNNPTIAAIAEAMAGQRPETGAIVFEEAISELAAAARTGDYGHIESRYGVKVDAAMKAGVVGYLKRLVDTVRRALKLDASTPDAEIYKLIEDANRYAKKGGVRGTSRRARAAQAASPKSRGFVSRGAMQLDPVTGRYGQVGATGFARLGDDATASENVAAEEFIDDLFGPNISERSMADASRMVMLQALDEDTNEALNAALERMPQDQPVTAAAWKAALQGDDLIAQRAFHGTPQKNVDRFTTEKIGTGEGNQAFGWGLYFAGNKDVADQYRRGLSSVGRKPGGTMADKLMQKYGGNRVDTINAIRRMRSGSVEQAERMTGMTFGSAESLSKQLDGAEAFIRADNNRGQLYQQELPEDNELLAYDTMLSQQPAAVRAAVKKIQDKWGDTDGGAIQGDMAGSYLYQMLGSPAFYGNDRDASMALLEAGIPGLRYLDGESRNRPLREIKREFLAELPEDAEFEDVTELLGTGNFSAKNEAIIKALQADDWLGFDYPAQALSTALSSELGNYDASPELVQAVAAAQEGGTYNYVIWDDSRIGAPEGLIASRTSSGLLRNLTPAEQRKVTNKTAIKIVEQLEKLPKADEMAAVAFAGRAKRGWYAGSAQAISAVFGPDAPRFAGLLAALSPQVSVQTNLKNALNTWANWVAAGRPQDRSDIVRVMGKSVEGSRGEASVLGSWINNSVEALTNEDPTTTMLSGPKVDSFMRNLLGNVEEVTNDAWMANYSAVEQTIFKGGKLKSGKDPGKGSGYLAMNARVREAAARLTKLTGETWTPAEVQETIWSWAKTLYELADSAGEIRTAKELVDDRAVTDELLQATPDFGTLFADPEYATILEEAGYGEQVKSIRAGRDAARAAGAKESGTGGEAGPFAAEAQRKFEQRAAARLDSVRKARLDAERGKDPVTEDEDFIPFSRAPINPYGDKQGTDLAGAPQAVTIKGRGKVQFHGFKPAQEIAARYAAKHGTVPPTTYAQVDEDRARRIAAAYEKMAHAPADPQVKRAYKAMIDETLAQYRDILATGLKVELIRGDDPYAATPRLAILDVVENNHLWVYPTDLGFGQDGIDRSDNPLLAETSFKISGQTAVANDIFRVVHDYFGHIANGVGFRADGEENAWREHSAMYSPLARRAMTSETRGQNSWVNYGPNGEANQTASAADTVYADQKTGLMPEWVSEEGRADSIVASRSGFSAKPRQPDAVSVDAYHYSNTPDLKALDPKKAGTGNAGRERKRFGMGNFGAKGGTAARLGFYVREPGKPVPEAEDVVQGQNLYRVQLDNLYDIDKDPRGIATSNNKDANEEAISDAGFDGFYAGPQSGIETPVAVVFDIGNKKIPVEAVEETLESQLIASRAAHQHLEKLGMKAQVSEDDPVDDTEDGDSGVFTEVKVTKDGEEVGFLTVDDSEYSRSWSADYVSVKEKYRRQGVARAMYSIMADHLGKMPERSIDQTQEGAALWDAVEASGSTLGEDPIIASRGRQRPYDSKAFGREIIPAARTAYAGLSQNAQYAIDAFQRGVLSQGNTIESDQKVQDEIETAFAPVREKLRTLFGDTVKLYRAQSRNTKGGKRTHLSWSFSDETGRAGAGEFMPERRKVRTEAEVDALVNQLRDRGHVRVGGNRYVRSNKWPEAGDDYFMIYDRYGHVVTDMVGLESLRRSLQSDNDFANEQNASDAARKAMFSADVPVDEIAWVMQNALSAEAIVRRDPVAAGDTEIIASRVTPAVKQAQRQTLLGHLATQGYPSGQNVQQAPGGRWMPLKEAADTFRIYMQDKMLPLLRAQERAGGANAPGQTSVNLADTMNAYRLETLMHGATNDLQNGSDQKYILPIQRRLKNIGMSVETFEGYLLARAAEEVNKAVASITNGMQDSAAGISTAEARAILAGTGPNPYTGKNLTPQELQQAASIAVLVDGMRDNILQNMVDAGQITKKLQAELKRKYPHYIPMRGKNIDEWMQKTTGTGKGLSQTKANIKRRLGRGQDNLPQNILGEMAGDMQRSNVAKAKAVVNQAFLRFAIANPMPDLFTVEPVDLEWKYSEATGEAYLGVKSTAEDVDRAILVMHNGQQVRIRFEDEQLRDAVMNMGVDDMKSFVRIIGAINRWRSAVLTRFNPAFVPVNMVRDGIFGMTAITAEHGPKIAAEVFLTYHQAALAVAQDNLRRPGDSSVPDAQKTMADWVREATELGMKTGVTVQDDVVDIQRRMSIGATTLMQLAAEGKPWSLAKESVYRAGKPILEAIESINDSYENALRVAVYVALRKKGMSRTKAAEYGKNVTINFNRKGKLGPILNALYLFYNASIQGTHAVVRVMRNPKVAVFLAGLAGLQAMLAMSMMEDDDDDGITDWDAVPDYAKRTSLIIPLGSLTGNGSDYFALPMPFGFNVVTYTGGRGMQWYKQGHRETDPNFIADVVKSTAEAFMPLPLADGYGSLFGDQVGFAMQLAANEDDLGRPIADEDAYAAYDEPRALTGRPDTPRFYHATAQLLAKLGGGNLEKRIPPVGYLDVAPEQIEAVVNYMGGGLASLGNKSVRWWEQMDASNLETNMDIISATPIASRFVGGGKEGRAIADRYYAERGELARKKDIIEDRIKRGEDPEKVLAEARKGDRTMRGQEPARYKRDGKFGFEGDIKRTEGGGVQIDAEEGSPLATFKSVEKKVKGYNKAIRGLRDPEITNAEAAAIAAGDDIKPSEIGLPDGYNEKAAAPNRVRQRAIKLLQDKRAEAQQDLLKALNSERRLGKYDKDDGDG